MGHGTHRHDFRLPVCTFIDIFLRETEGKLSVGQPACFTPQAAFTTLQAKGEGPLHYTTRERTCGTETLGSGSLQRSPAGPSQRGSVGTHDRCSPSCRHPPWCR